MKMFINKSKQFSVVLMSLVLFLSVSTAQAVINGQTGTIFNMTSDYDRVSTGDGNSVYFWGFKMNADTSGIFAQYPGPTLIVNQGDTITINLTNALPDPVSIIFPGQAGVIASGGNPGLLTNEAAAGVGTVSYTFTAANAGTYLYHSGTNMEKQIEMGLLGVIIVRPATAGQAYDHADSRYDREYLYLMTEMDLQFHEAVEFGRPYDNTAFYPEYWFLNGRTYPDNVFPAGAGWLPNQPYNMFPLMHPGERLLLRVISAGRDAHPLHTHGNNFDLIARDGRLLQTAPGMGANLAYSDNSLNAQPGGSYDFIFQWTGKKMGWDFYGPSTGATAHTCTDMVNNETGAPGPDGFQDDSTPRPVNYYEPCLDHGAALPVLATEIQDVTIGGYYSGSPFLGQNGELPPGEGGLNPFDGFFFPWHSHHEKELTNFDIYPGGLLTFFAVVPWDFGI